MDNHNLLFQVVVYLAAAVVAVPISKRLGLGSVIGYLLAGVAIGPFGMKAIDDPERVLHFSEFGVVLLLFLIGLELNPAKLWALRKPIAGTGSAQVLATIAAFTALGLGFGQPLPVSLIAAMGFALSSTAIALQILRERGLLTTAGGHTSFSVLLFQDLAVIPMLAMIPLLSAQTAATDHAQQSAGWEGLAKSVGAILAVIVGGRTLLRPIFRFIAQTGLRETFTAFSLFLVLGISALMQAVGLSMALGSFLAGVLLADSEYRHELEIDIEPFKGLLLGLFFISVGMSIDLGVLGQSPGLIAGLVLSLVAVKILVLFGVGRAFGLTGNDTLTFGLTLSQGGEFAFVLFGLGSQLQILDASVSAVLVVTVALSMLTTPFLMLFHERIGKALFNRNSPNASKPMPEGPQSEENPVIIAGYGRFGQMVGRLLHSLKIGATVVDHDPNQIELMRKFGWKTFYGDATRIDLLHAAGAAKAKLLVIAIDDMDAAFATAALAQEHFPNLKILARARGRTDAFDFLQKNIQPFRETLGSAIEMGEAVLREMGFSAYESRKMALRFKRHDAEMLIEGAKRTDEERSSVSFVKKSREELERLMLDDTVRSSSREEDGWG